VSRRHLGCRRLTRVPGRAGPRSATEWGPRAGYPEPRVLRARAASRAPRTCEPTKVPSASVPAQAARGTAGAVSPYRAVSPRCPESAIPTTCRSLPAGTRSPRPSETTRSSSPLGRWPSASRRSWTSSWGLRWVIQVRFTDHSSGNTLVKVMTDGILLAEMQRDRELRRYDTVIIDKAHERSLNIDFIRRYLKQLSRRRPDLKVIITSATIDSQRFSKHFDDASIIEVLATSVAETSGMSGTLGPRASRDTASAPRFSTSRSSPSPGPVPASGPGVAAGSRPGSASGCTPRRASRLDRSSPTPRSCAPTWRRSSCR